MISVKKLLEGKQNNRILALAPDAMVIDALELMTKENVGAVMVVENEKLVGIFSERDYARKGIIMGRKAPDMNMEDCMQLFSDKRIRHLPVVHDSDLLGMLSIGDIVTAIIVEQKEHIQFLEKYISS